MRYFCHFLINERKKKKKETAKVYAKTKYLKKQDQDGHVTNETYHNLSLAKQSAHIIGYCI